MKVLGDWCQTCMKPAENKRLKKQQKANGAES